MKGLARSGDNLFVYAKKFIESSTEVALLSAYIKVSSLEQLNQSKKIKQIVVRWEMKDLCSQASDFELLFDYCRKHDIELYRNTRLHLKVIWDLGSSAFLGSANISGRGIESKSNDFNWELNKVANYLSIEDQQYLQSRLLESEIITVERMLALKAHKNAIAYQEPIIPEIEFPKMTDDHFLITQLPFYRNVTSLFESYVNSESLCVDDQRDLAHDLALYEVPPGLSESEFQLHIANAFLNHPFIKSFCNWVKSIEADHPDHDRRASARFGSVRRWFADHTTTVPTPRPWELSEDINVLYNWICHFNPDFRQTGRPYEGGTGGSNLLQYRPSIT